MNAATPVREATHLRRRWLNLSEVQRRVLLQAHATPGGEFLGKIHNRMATPRALERQGLMEVTDSGRPVLTQLGRAVAEWGSTPDLPAFEVPPHDAREFVLALIEANEGLAEAQVRIALAAGLPKSASADQIVAEIERLRERDRIV